MLVKPKKRYHLAAEMLKWWSCKKMVGSENQENEIKEVEDEKGQPAKPGSALPAQPRPQKFCRRRRPYRRVQLYTPANFPNPSADGVDPWKSPYADEDYFTGRKLIRIIETSTLSIKTVETVVCFLCQFEDNTFRYIPRKAVTKHDPMTVIHYFESMIHNVLKMPKKARKRCAKIINKVKYYTVEEILDKRINDEGEEEYEIKWVGYNETSWEPNSSLTLCQDALDQFEEDYALRRQVPSQQPQLLGSPQPEFTPPPGSSQPRKALSSRLLQPKSTPPSGFSQPKRAPPSSSSQLGQAPSSVFPQPEFTPPPGSPQPKTAQPSRFSKPRPSPPSGFSRSIRNRMKVFLPCKTRLKCQIQKRKNSFIKAHLKRTAKQQRSLPSTIFHKADTVFPTDKLKKIHTMFVGRVGHKTRIAHFLCIMQDKEQLIYKSEIVKKHWPEILAKFYLRQVQFHGSQLLYPYPR
ncbi:hypothetical protein CAEBREN_02118 [Caenorhabditis brenneri]|uniref:Chromo domain-containing protein n=1 Tax=Caenorhabditis brenneri TaxID=135651 RepID=G0PFN8_CAEBE|nr:hypothetical protein CAEBREN_02118 [Caenorhabditis brenneri]